MFLNKSGEFACEFDSLFAVVFYMHPDEHIGKAHNPKAYFCQGALKPSHYGRFQNQPL
jgi:hypothetical protein